MGGGRNNVTELGLTNERRKNECTEGKEDLCVHNDAEKVHPGNARDWLLPPLCYADKSSVGVI